MLEFKIQIAGGSLVEINEPIGFDKVDFNLTRSETLHSISSNFAGNSIEFEFNKDVHYNVFDAIIQEYNVNGFLGNVMLFITYNGNELFKGSFDFSTTQTDMLNYLKCQIVNKDKLYLLDKNKGVAVDLLGDKDLDDNTADIVPIVSVSLPPITLKKESIWEDKEVKLYQIVGGDRAFNNAQTTTKYEINDSLSWMSFIEPYAGNAGRNFQLVSAKENLANVNVKIEYTSGTYFQNLGGGGVAELWLAYGQERPDLNNAAWDSQINKVKLASLSIGTVPNPLPAILTYSLPAIPRGSGVWLYWRYSGDIIVPATLYNTGSKITITADAKNYYSVTDSIKYKDLVANAVKKIANINNVQWNVNYYDNTLSFNGNLIRHINDKGFTIKWQDIAKQLNERNLGAYYNESTDTLVIDHRNHILGSNNLGLFGDYAKKEFYFVTEDEKFIVNSFKYKYSKYQALKENNVDGNYSSVHGETEWYIDNKTFEGDISVDLPFIRDSFMIEDLRIKALAYKEDTATNEDSTVVLLETKLNTPQLTVEETIVVNTSFTEAGQVIQNDSSFNWTHIGLNVGQIVYVNNEKYSVVAVDPYQIILLPLDTNEQELNGQTTILLRYDLNTDRLAKLDNGLYNQQFSVRQNILYWQNTLGVANYYAKKPIINTLYKENKNAVVYGLIENSDIDFNEPLHKPRVIETKVLISVDDYFYLSNNKIGFIKIYNSKDEEISIYLTELKALFLNGCNQMEANIKGWVKNEIPSPPPIVTNTVVTRSTVGDLFYPALNFVFNDVTERITIRNGSIVLYINLDYSQICAPSFCFANYSGTKNYLLSL